MTGPNLEPVIEAFERKDYRAATALLKPLYKSHSQDPWVQFYIARLQEVSQQPQKAEQRYRQLLKTAATNSKLISQARQGLQRIEAQEREQRQAAIAQATTDAENTALGVLVLEPLDAEAKQKAIPGFARLMQLEPYSARLLLPSRHWRFYRTGPIGLLQVYAQDLASVGVPAFCVSLATLAAYPVFRASRLEVADDRLVAHPLAPAPSQGSLPPAQVFRRGEVSQVIAGALPLFERVVDSGLKPGRFGPRRATVRKETVQDYAKVLDLHLGERRQIVRLCDRDYAYPAPVSSALEQRYAPIAQRWQHQLNQWQGLFPRMLLASEFQAFADTVLDQTECLKRIEPHLRISAAATQTNRADEELWDAAFQLYSSLHLWRMAHPPSAMFPNAPKTP